MSLVGGNRRHVDVAPLIGVVGQGSVPTAAARCKVSVRTLYRARRNDRGISVWQADRMAIAAGLMPHQIWPEWWDWSIEDSLDQVLAS